MVASEVWFMGTQQLLEKWRDALKGETLAGLPAMTAPEQEQFSTVDLTGSDAGSVEALAYLAADQSVREFAPGILEKAGHKDAAARLRKLPAITSAETAATAGETMDEYSMDPNLLSRDTYGVIIACGVTSSLSTQSWEDAVFSAGATATLMVGGAEDRGKALAVVRGCFDKLLAAGKSG